MRYGTLKVKVLLNDEMFAEIEVGEFPQDQLYEYLPEVSQLIMDSLLQEDYPVTSAYREDGAWDEAEFPELEDEEEN